MKEKYRVGLDLIEENKYEEAYQYFSNLVKENESDLQARSLRVNVDFFKLRLELETTYEDMKYIVNKKKKLGEKHFYPFMCVLAEDLGKYDEAVLYGEAALVNDSKFTDTIYAILGRCYFLLGTQNSGYADDCYHKSLDYFKRALEITEDDKIDLYKGLVDVYFKLDNFEECLEYTNKLMGLGVLDGIMYFYRGMCKFYLAENKDDYEDAIYNFDKALNFNPDDDDSKCYRALSLYNFGEEEQAEKLLMELYNKDKNQSLLNAIFHLYASLEKYSKIIDFPDRESIMNNVPNKFFLARTLDFFGNDQEKEEGLKYYKELFEETKELDILHLICGAYKIKNDYQGLLNYLQELLKNNESLKNRIDELIAQTLREMGADYSTFEPIISNLAKIGLFKEEYLYNELYINPNRNHKLLKSMVKGKYFKSLNCQMQASILLYGELDLKTNKRQMDKLIEEMSLNSYHPCYLTLIGRAFELLKQDNKTAYKFYKRAYEITKDHYNDYCNCSASFFAHMLYNGYCEEVNEEDSKRQAYEVIKTELKKKNYCNCSNVHFLYSYFALMKVEGFDISEAIKMLEISRRDSIYDLDNIYLLMKCYEFIDVNKSSEYLGLFYKVLPQANRLQRKYYLEKMKETTLENDDIIYPFLNNR